MKDFYKTINCTVEDAEITGIFDSAFFFPSELTNIPHRHKSTELHISGSPYLIEDVTGKNSVEVFGDTVALVPENFYHNCIATKESSDRFILRIAISPIKNYGGKMPIYEKLCGEISEKRLLSLRVKDAYVLFERIKNELLLKKIGSEEAAKALFSQFAVLLSRAFENRYTETGKKTKAEKTVSDDMIARNEKIEHFFFGGIPDPDLKADELAKELGLSIRQLNRIFKSYYGLSFGQMLTETRLIRAEKMLSLTNEPVEKIAFDVGYRSFSAFLTAFKKRYNMTPGKYRRVVRMS